MCQTIRRLLLLVATLTAIVAVRAHARSEVEAGGVCQQHAEVVAIDRSTARSAEDLLPNAIADLWVTPGQSVTQTLDDAWLAARDGRGDFDRWVLAAMLLDGPAAMLDCGEATEGPLCIALRSRGVAVDDVRARARAAQALEPKLPALIDWWAECTARLEGVRPDDASIERMMRAAHDWRSGRHDQAIARLEVARPIDRAERDAIDTLRAARSDRGPVPDTDLTDWVIHRPSPGLKLDPGFSFDFHEPRMRAIRWRLLGMDAQAEETLLLGQWRATFWGGDDAGDLMLRELLRERHGIAALREEWTRAEATIAIDEDGARWTFLGHTLPLPHAVTCWTSDRQEIEVRLRSEQIVARLRASDLYRGLFETPRPNEDFATIEVFAQECAPPL